MLVPGVLLFVGVDHRRRRNDTRPAGVADLPRRPRLAGEVEVVVFDGSALVPSANDAARVVVVDQLEDDVVVAADADDLALVVVVDRAGAALAIGVGLEAWTVVGPALGRVVRVDAQGRAADEVGRRRCS